MALNPSQTGSPGPGRPRQQGCKRCTGGDLECSQRGDDPEAVDLAPLPGGWSLLPPNCAPDAQPEAALWTWVFSEVCKFLASSQAVCKGSNRKFCETQE